MYKKFREELINELKQYGSFDDDCERFYNLSHQEKINEFESFCCRQGGYIALLLSDDIICDNKELVMIAKEHGFYRGFHLISERLLNDPEIALAFAHCNRYEYTKISKSLRDDPELMLKAIIINPRIYCSLPVKVKVNRDILLEIARNDPYELTSLIRYKIRKEYLEPLQNDKYLASIVAETAPSVLKEFFSEEILKDEEIQSIAFQFSDRKQCKKRLSENTWALQYVDPLYWLNDRKLVKKALHENGYLLSVLPESYQADKELVMIAVKNYPNALDYCSEELLDDIDVITAALQEDSEEVLSYASERLQSDYDLVYKAVKIDALNLQFASDELRDNRDIVIRALKTYGGVLEDASERLQADEELKELASKNM